MIMFGPQWIRTTLSNDANPPSNSASNSSTNRSNAQNVNSYSSVAAAPRFAEHRYGREEMLSLYEREIHAPQELQDFGNIFVRRKQPPLALTDNSEDDNNARHWQRQNPSSTGAASTPIVPVGLRGGDSNTHSVRGRGRQRQFHTPGQNSITYHNSRFVGREESQSESGRSFFSSWNDRGNAGFDSSGGEWINQRRDFTSQPPHTNRWSDWRRPGIARINHQEDSEDTRRVSVPADASAASFRHRTQVGPGTSHPSSENSNRYSWRNKDVKSYDRGFTGDRDWSDRPGRDRGPPRTLRRGWSADGNDENSLPEWAVETTNTETSGSFDSTGAFHAPTKSGNGGDEAPPALHPLTHSHSQSSFMTNKSTPADQQSSGNNNSSSLSRSLTQSSINVQKGATKKHVSFAKEENKNDEIKSEPPTCSTAPVKNPSVTRNKQFDVTKINFKKVSPPEKDTPANTATTLDWWSPGAMFVNDNSADNKVPEVQETKPPNQEFAIEKTLSDLSLKDDNLIKTEKFPDKEKTKDVSDEKKPNTKNENAQKEMVLNKANQLRSTQVNVRKEKYDTKPKKSESVEMNHSDKDCKSQSECPKNFEHVQHVPMRYDFNDESDIKSVLLTSTDKSLREQHQNFVQPSKEPITLPDLTKPPPQPNLESHDLLCDANRKENNYLMLLNDPELLLPCQMERPFGFEENQLIPNQQDAKLPQQPPPIYQQSQVSHSSVPPQTSSNFWFYKDPQGEVQGPFEASHMAEWYNSGFFKTDLLVRRDCDLYLYPLGSLGPTPPFLQSEPSVAPPANKAMPNFNRTFAPMPEMVSNEDFFISQQQRQTGVMNVNTLQSPMAEQQQMLYYTNPTEQQVLPSMVQPPLVQPTLDSLAMTIASPVEQATINTQPTQPPLEESMSAFLRQQASSSSWNNAPNEMPWPNLFQQQTPWDSKPYMDINNQQNAQANLDMNRVQNTSNTLAASSLVGPNDKHQRMLAQLPSSLFEERSMRPNKPSFMMWDGYELTEDNFKEKGPWGNVAGHPYMDKIPERSDDYNRFAIEKDNNMNKQMPQDTFKNSKEEEDRFFTMFPHCRTTMDDAQREVVLRNATSVDQMSTPQQMDDFTNMGFQKVQSKREEKQLKLQKLKEARKKADMLKKEEEEQMAFINNYKESDEMKCHPFDAQKIQEVQKQRTLNAKIAPWSVVMEMDRNGSKLGLSEIQRLEREKKLEQTREQVMFAQQMFTQQQRVNQLREQEFSQGWSKIPIPQKSLNEIQMEELHQTMKVNQQAMVAKEIHAASKQPVPRALTPQSQNPWTTNPGFWEALSPTTSQKQTPIINKQPVVVPLPAKKIEKAIPVSNAPTAIKNTKTRTTTGKKPRMPTSLSNQTFSREGPSSCQPEQKNFDEWCAEELKPWKDNIDIPTFVNFLKDVQSSVDVADYIKSVIGETPEAMLFIRQYLDTRYHGNRRDNDNTEELFSVQNTKLNSNEFQEVKGKNKKVKKNKMLKVDARILGFSTTASEDRINVGDIDSV